MMQSLTRPLSFQLSLSSKFLFFLFLILAPSLCSSDLLICSLCLNCFWLSIIVHLQFFNLSNLRNLVFAVSVYLHTMGFRYHPVRTDEKFPQAYRDRSSTVNSLESALQGNNDGSEITDGPSSHQINLKWIWLFQAALFTVSCSMFLSVIFIRSSTLKHVREFSAYCKSVSFCPRQNMENERGSTHCTY
jgi:hypothetical protein